MLAIDRFKQLNPSINSIKITKDDYDKIVGWTLLDEGGEVIGYGFSLKVPEQTLEIPDAEEFDSYVVTGILSLDHVLLDLSVEVHEDYENPVWAEGVLEDDYIQQYIGLTAGSVKLSPNGKIDAISESTVSCAAITESVRNRMEAIKKFIG